LTAAAPPDPDSGAPGGSFGPAPRMRSTASAWFRGS